MSNSSTARSTGETSRYIVVWSLSRGIDFGIVASSFYYNWLPLFTAWAIGLGIDCCIDFFCQKFWVFKETNRYLLTIFREFGLYVMFRTFGASATGGLTYLLYQATNFHPAAIYLCVAISFWFVLRALNRWLFKGTLSKLVVTNRRTVQQ